MVLLVYLVVQPRPVLVGSDAGVSSAYVGSTCVCGDWSPERTPAAGR